MTDEGAGQVAGADPVEDDGPGADPVEAAGPVALPAYDSPGARLVVGRGLQVAVAANRDLRRASFHIGFLVLLLVGPPIAASVVAIGRLDPAVLEALGRVDGSGADVDPAVTALVMLFFRLSAAFALAALALLAVLIDAQALAISIIGGRHVDRPLDLDEALVRARQVFWRLVAASLLVGIISTIVTTVADGPVRAIAGDGALGEMAGSVLATLVVSPFLYTSVAIVLGDSRAFASLSRSLRLARARVRVTAVLVLYPVIVGAITVFAIMATVDVLDRLGRVAGVDRIGPEALVLAGTLVASFAVGSLILTIDAIVAGPQVVAYVGLTQGAPGLDRARRPVVAAEEVVTVDTAPLAVDPPAEPRAEPPRASAWTSDREPTRTGRTRFPLISRPMMVAIAIVWLLSLSAIGPA